MRRLVRAGVVAAVALWLASQAALAGQDCRHLYAIGDLHGADEAFVAMLRELDLVDDDLAWSGGDDCLIQTGDVLDRGAESRRLLDLLMRLHEESGGRVRMLLGNHEIMNMLGDLRYVSPGEFAAFAADETAEERAAGLREFLEPYGEVDGDPEVLRALFDERYPPGWFAHRRAFGPDGRYGSWLLERPVAIKDGGTLFVHGGLSLADAALTPAELTERVHREIRLYHELRAKLIAAGWLDSLAPFGESFGIVAAAAEQAAAAGGADPETLRAADRFLELGRNASCIRTDGPVWNRQLAEADELEFDSQLRTILEASGATRFVVGHTTAGDGRIATRFHGRVFAIDTGAGPAYDGRISALEIRDDGQVSAVYLDGRKLLAPAPRDEAAIERALRDGTVVKSEEIGDGITKPLRLTIEHEGHRMRAAFKYLHVRQMGLTRFRGRPSQFNFTDSYRYERAAYLLDRFLGLDMVPVSVIREVDGTEGAAVEWIEDAVSEAERRAEGLELGDPLQLVQQRELMRLFDALIANEDRHLGNELLTKDDGRLHLIDHTRSFREHRDLPDGFEDSLLTLPRRLLPRLEALDRPTLDAMMGDLLTGRQIKTLLARRDRILDKIRADRERYGDDAVFFIEPPAGGQS